MLSKILNYNNNRTIVFYVINNHFKHKLLIGICETIYFWTK